MTTKFDYTGEAAQVACAEIGFDPDVHFVGVRVALRGQIVVRGSVGKPSEFQALRSAVRARGWHYEQVDMRSPAHEPPDDATDRHCEEIVRGRPLTEAEWRECKTARAVAAAREAERRGEVDARIRALASQ